MKKKIGIVLMMLVLALPLSIASHNGMDDTDKDGVLNMNDRCARSPMRALYVLENGYRVRIVVPSTVNEVGCAQGEIFTALDQDNDGIVGNYDGCKKAVEDYLGALDGCPEVP